MADTITREELQAELTLDLETGVFRRARPIGAERIGDIAGNVGANGRRLIGVRGVRYLASHLVWLWIHGELPKGYIKQRNGDYDDCSPCNIYEESARESMKNSAIRSDNVSGRKGVSWNTERQRWVATIKVGKKLVALGRYNEKEDAVHARERAEKELEETGSVAGVKHDAAAMAMEARLRRLWKKILEATDNNVGWDKFSEFESEIGAVPKGMRGIEPIDVTKPIGPKNWYFVKRFDRRTPGGRSEYGRYLREKNPEVYKNSDLKKSFGITLEQYKDMLIAQKGVCAICGQPETAILYGKVKSLAVEHHHESGRIRSLACSACNAVIGYSKENIDILKAVIAYLEKHKEADSTNVVPIRKDTK